ncbi:hypothetical protein ACI2OX_09020 [Bacillus sp. N9]
MIRFILEKQIDVPQQERRIYIASLIYFIDYLLQLPTELTKRLRTEIRLSKEEIGMLYLDRNNLPLTLGELIEESKRKGIEKGIVEAKKNLALKLIQEEFPDEYIAKLTELSLKQIKNLRSNE